ncbi:MAG: V-type ATPase 116kDa subunit family protein [Paludibacter sp.]|nr:V-type ATPase 116kDa subunit family protein [Paludibacter sp.]
MIYHKHYLDFLEKIRELGVLHVIEKAEGSPEDETLNRKMQLSSALKTALTELKKYLPENAVLADVDKKMDGNALLMEIEETFNKLEVLTHDLHSTQRELERISVWGDFSVQRIHALKDAGFELRFFNCNLRKYNLEWDTLYNAFEINTIAPLIYFVTVNKPGTEIDVDADPMKMPEKNALEISEMIASIQTEIEKVKKEIDILALGKYQTLEYYYKMILSEIDFSKVILNTRSEVENKVMMLEGFCPEEVEVAIKEYLDKSGVFYEVTDPEITENVPIKLKNNAFSKLFEPITRLYSLPNYSELDPTPLFAPFFMLFFGLCLGDGGYGILILAATTFLKRKSKPEMKGLLTLGQYLGLMTIVVGILTGSFMGISLDQVEWKWLAGVKQYFITQNNFGDKFGGYSPLMALALIIGIIQILFGMVVNAIKVQKQHGFKYAINHFAWVVLIIALAIIYFLSSKNVAPVFMYILYGITALCALCVIFYNSPGKNIIINFGSALWNTYNMATGLLGDSLSYIRLFALGLTGSILGGVFNMLAVDMTADIAFAPGRWLVMLLILLVGHSINFALSIIGAFVHPLRLTFVEYYKNSGFEGGGKEYKPFKKVI